MNGLANDIENDRTIVWCAPVSQTCFWFTRVGVAELTNLSFSVDAETFNIAVAFHFSRTHYTTNPNEALIDREYNGNRTRRIALGILPIRLNLSLPRPIQVWKWN